MSNQRRLERGSDHGMTAVELLVVMGIITLLLSIVIVAVNAATKTAQGAHTRTLMSSISQALVRFKEDVGYYPPVLGPPTGGPIVDVNDFRRLKDPPDPAAGLVQYTTDVQEWHSLTTLPEYLLGYGHHNQDGYGVIRADQGGPLYDGTTTPAEIPPLGIRHPGPDGVWGATVYGTGLLTDRMQQSSPNADKGKVYGPYLQLEDDRLTTSFYLSSGTADPDNDPLSVLDYWGEPIRYYRRVYPLGSLQSSYNTFDPDDHKPTLSDVFMLRPYDIPPDGAVIDGLADSGGDTTSIPQLRSAEFALFSPGPDKWPPSHITSTLRTDERNQDNIVVLSP